MLIHGRAEIEAYWRAGIALGLSGVTFERQVLAAIAGSVVEVGRYALSVDVARPAGGVDRGTNRSSTTRSRAAPCWTVDVFNPDEPGGSSRRA